jgi:UDP-glucuronate 4-epimerase
MKFLVTGSCGFIGFHLCKNLLEEEHDVLGIDNLNSYYDVYLKETRLNLLEKFKNFKFLKIDLTDKESLNEIFEDFKPSIVVNLAAQAGVRYSSINPNAYIDSNILGFLNIINLCSEFDLEKLIYASSSSVYGSSSDVPYKEGSSLDPISLYGKTKLFNELISESYAQRNNFQTIGLRFFTVYGPYGRPDMAYFRFSKNIKENSQITIYNKGKMSRDMTYIDDIIEGVKLAIKADNLINPHEVFNLGNTKPIKTSDLLSLIEDHYKKKALINHEETEDEVKITHADIYKANSMIGYLPKTNIYEGMDNFFSWFDAK